MASRHAPHHADERFISTPNELLVAGRAPTGQLGSSPRQPGWPAHGSFDWSTDERIATPLAGGTVVGFRLKHLDLEFRGLVSHNFAHGGRSARAVYVLAPDVPSQLTRPLERDDLMMAPMLVHCRGLDLRRGFPFRLLGDWDPAFAFSSEWQSSDNPPHLPEQYTKGLPGDRPSPASWAWVADVASADTILHALARWLRWAKANDRALSPQLQELSSGMTSPIDDLFPPPRAVVGYLTSALAGVAPDTRRAIQSGQADDHELTVDLDGATIEIKPATHTAVLREEVGTTSLLIALDALAAPLEFYDSLAPGTTDRIQRAFGEHWQEAIVWLSLMKPPDSHAVQLIEAAIEVSGGSIERLPNAVDWGRRNWRQLIDDARQLPDGRR